MSKPKYLEVASGFLGAGVEKIVSRGSQEIDKSQGYDINDPVKRVQTWVDWGSALGSAVILLWRGEKLQQKHPKVHNFLEGWGHGAVANAGNTIEETATGIAPYQPIPKYAQKTITTKNSGGIQIKSLVRPGEINVQQYRPLSLS